MHIVLLGDSIFDNAVYINGGVDVRGQVQKRLNQGERAMLLAVDGNVIKDVSRQLGKLPKDATHLFLSIGGNDLLQLMNVLSQPASSVAEVLGLLGGLSETFERDYHQMLDGVLTCKLPMTLCTIYYPRFPDEGLQRIAITALTVFNDAIMRAAFRAGLPLIDLRLVCADDEDYANPIEPSEGGGAKIAERIVKVAREHDFEQGRTEVYV